LSADGYVLRDAATSRFMLQSPEYLRHTLRGYVRDAELFRDHAGAGLL
jgi:hypothetical protein